MNKLINPVKNLFYGLAYLVVILFSAAILAYIIETGFGKDGEECRNFRAVGFMEVDEFLPHATQALMC